MPSEREGFPAEPDLDLFLELGPVRSPLDPCSRCNGSGSEPAAGEPAGDELYAASGIGGRLREERERAGLSQAELAERLGASQAAVSRWETGNRDVSAAELVRIAEALSVPAASLLPGQAPRGALGAAEGREPPLPEGTYGRIELPGWRNHTGWVTGSMRDVVTVRDWDGHVIAEVVPGPNAQLLHLPTPLKRPEPPPERAALTSGDRDPWVANDPDCECSPGYTCAVCRPYNEGRWS